jgi:hypothetical protein
LDGADNIAKLISDPLGRLGYQRRQTSNGLGLLTTKNHEFAHLLGHELHGKSKPLEIRGHGHQGLFDLRG